MLFNLRQKLFVGIGVLVVSLMGTVLVVANIFIAPAIEARIRHDLLASQKVFEEFRGLRFQELSVSARLTSEIPHLKAMVTTPDLDHATLLDSARAMQQLVHSDLLVLADAQGRLLASVTEPERVGESLLELPAFAAAFRGDPYQALWAERGRIYQIVASPFVFGDEIAGALLLGFEVDGRRIESMEAMLNCHIALISAESVLTSVRSAAVFDGFRADSRAIVRFRPHEIVTEKIGGERYLLLASPPDSSGLFYVLARSLDSELGFFQQLQRSLLLSGTLILVVALLLGWFYTQRISRPIRALLVETKRIASGDFESKIVSSSTDEIGQLAASFNTMTEALRYLLQKEKQLATQAASAAAEKQRAEELAGINEGLNREIGERKRVEAALAEEKAALEKVNRIMMDREERILELKQEINQLLQASGNAKKYDA